MESLRQRAMRSQATLSDMPTCRASVLTARTPGAIAIILCEGDVGSLIHALTGHELPPIDQPALRQFADIDEGVIAALSPDLVQLMPHGGPRVVQRVLQWLRDRDVDIVATTEIADAHAYPESRSDIDALMLCALARARSPLAIDLLLAQPRHWTTKPQITEDDRARSHRLNRLIDPPLVALAGPANVGKSTLTNALLGRTQSIAFDQPGTTRDYTAGMIDLEGLVVRWLDTPGLRTTDDPIERDAIAVATRVMHDADLLIAITDRDLDWPTLPREADLRVASRSDLGERTDADVCVSAITGDGLSQLVRTVRNHLIPPADLAHDGPWIFDDRLG